MNGRRVGHPSPDALGSRHRALRLARRFRRALHALPPLPPSPNAPEPAPAASPPGLTLGEVLDLHGTASLGSLVLFWSMFGQLPVGGVGNVAGVALWWLAWDWWRDRVALRSSSVMRLRLSLRWSHRLLKLLAQCYRQAGLWLRPRWPHWQAPWTRGWWAAWVALQALVIFLPVPMGNLLPGLSLSALGLGRLVQDGTLYLASLLLGLAGLVYMAWLGDITWRLTLEGWHLLHSLVTPVLQAWGF